MMSTYDDRNYVQASSAGINDATAYQQDYTTNQAGYTNNQYGTPAASNSSSLLSLPSPNSSTYLLRARARLHQLYTRLSPFEWFLFQTLQFFGVITSGRLIEPPGMTEDDPIVKQIERTQQQMIVGGGGGGNGSGVEKGHNNIVQRQQQTSAAASSSSGWSRFVLDSMSQYLYPTEWQPLSFRKMVLVVSEAEEGGGS